MSTAVNRVAAPDEAKQPSTTTFVHDADFRETIRSNAHADFDKRSCKVGEAEIENSAFDSATTTVWRFAMPEHRAQLEDGQTPRPAIISVHSGRLVVFEVDIFRHQLRQYVDPWVIQMFAVDCGLTPENHTSCPAPDVYAAL